VEEYDYYADGTWDRRLTRTYDTAGHMLTILTEFADYTDETTRMIYSYDADGNVLTESGDADADGDIESVLTYTYNAEGQLLTQVCGTADGTFCGSYTYTYDC